MFTTFSVHADEQELWGYSGTAAILRPGRRTHRRTPAARRPARARANRDPVGTDQAGEARLRRLGVDTDHRTDRCDAGAGAADPGCVEEAGGRAMTAENGSRPPASAQYGDHRPGPDAPQPTAPGAPRVILLLTADTGGGHRAAAEAVREAFNSRTRRVRGGHLRPADGCRRQPGRRLGVPPLRVAALGGSEAVVPAVHATNRSGSLRIMQHLLTRLASAPIAAALDRHQPVGGGRVAPAARHTRGRRPLRRAVPPGR